MGDPRNLKRKFKKPKHPWQKLRIDNEKELTKNYGLVNKKEIWRSVSKFKKFTKQAKKLLGARTEQSKKEEKEILTKLKKYDLVSEKAKIEDVLNLTVENFLDRRLQTKVYKMGLAKTVKQARQFIVHGHISLDGRKINSPSYLVKSADKIYFKENSKLMNPDHPERIKEKEEPKIIENDKQ